MQKLLKETTLLDFSSARIQDIILENKWDKTDKKNKILLSYNFVRDKIAFGYNIDDSIPASKVLEDGIGQCNTKGILLMAFLRALGIPCRIHGFTIYKPLQKGAMKGFYYWLAPKEIIHSWVEIYYNDKWFNLEGFILDIDYLKKLQAKFSDCKGSFCGYGVSTYNFENPTIYWDENDTYIQKEGIAKDFGIFDTPDDFLSFHHQSLNPMKTFLFQKVARHLMNRNIRKIRGRKN